MARQRLDCGAHPGRKHPVDLAKRAVLRAGAHAGLHTVDRVVEDVDAVRKFDRERQVGQRPLVPRDDFLDGYGVSSADDAVRDARRVDARVAA